jgi:hypothetical protein
VASHLLGRQVFVSFPKGDLQTIFRIWQIISLIPSVVGASPVTCWFEVLQDGVKGPGLYRPES